MKKEEFLKDTSSVDRIYGEEDKVDDLKKYLESTFANQKKESWELEKSEEDKMVISAVLEKMPIFLKKYGGTMPPITLDHFHAVDINASDAPRMKGTAGYQPRYQRIKYLPNELDQEPRLSKAQTMAHEVLHFCSYQYFKEKVSDSESSDASGSKIDSKRVGLSISSDRGDEDLEEASVKLDEAVMDELAIRFTKEFLSEEPLLLEDLPSKQDDYSNPDSLHELKKDESGRLYFQPEGYAEEIQVLNNLIKHIVTKKPEIYKTEEDVFELFAKAALTNNLMPLVRALRASMGKIWPSMIKVLLTKRT
jgi:hypothetical protein